MIAPFPSEAELIVELLRRERGTHEHHLDYANSNPPDRPPWAGGMDPDIRLLLAQINAAIARRLPRSEPPSG